MLSCETRKYAEHPVLPGLELMSLAHNNLLTVNFGSIKIENVSLI